jgi:putative transposase
VIARGNRRERIFLDDRDRRKFLSVLAKCVNRYNLLCHAFCLMPNHYHLLIETPDGNLARAMRQLNGVYSQAFNRRHAKVGHVMQGRYKAIVVEKESHLLEVCRYIVLNPVRARFVPTPGEWRWSSYRSQVGETTAPKFLTIDWLLRQFHEADRVEAERRYRSFVWERIVADPESDALLVAGPILGSPEFVDRFEQSLVAARPVKEIPKASRFSVRPDLSDVFSECDGRRDNASRVRRAPADHGYTMVEIARHLGVHYSTVSRLIRNVEMLLFKT